jgi:hypothetical protein
MEESEGMKSLETGGLHLNPFISTPVLLRIENLLEFWEELCANQLPGTKGKNKELHDCL